MAICTLNKDLLRTSSCGYQIMEVTNIWLVNAADLTSTALSADTDGCEQITAITLAADAKAYKVEPQRNSASFSDELVVSDNGSKYRTHSVTFSVAGQYTACNHAALDALSLGRYFVVIDTADGQHIGLGRIAPLEAETATLNGGSDENGMTITLSGNVAESALPLSDAAYAVINPNA